jgi:hypothetical protein
MSKQPPFGDIRGLGNAFGISAPAATNPQIQTNSAAGDVDYEPPHQRHKDNHPEKMDEASTIYETKQPVNATTNIHKTATDVVKQVNATPVKKTDKSKTYADGLNNAVNKGIAQGGNISQIPIGISNVAELQKQDAITQSLKNPTPNPNKQENVLGASAQAQSSTESANGVPVSSDDPVSSSANTEMTNDTGTPPAAASLADTSPMDDVISTVPPVDPVTADPPVVLPNVPPVDNSQVDNKVEGILRAQVSDLQNLLRESKSEASISQQKTENTANNAVFRLDADIARLRSVNKALEDELNIKKERTLTFRMESDDKTIEINALKARIVAMPQQDPGLRSRLEDALTKSTDLEARNRQLNVEIATLTEQNTTLKREKLENDSQMNIEPNKSSDKELELTQRLETALAEIATLNQMQGVEHSATELETSQAHRIAELQKIVDDRKTSDNRMETDTVKDIEIQDLKNRLEGALQLAKEAKAGYKKALDEFYANKSKEKKELAFKKMEDDYNAMQTNLAGLIQQKETMETNIAAQRTAAEALKVKELENEIAKSRIRDTQLSELERQRAEREQVQRDKELNELRALASQRKYEDTHGRVDQYGRRLDPYPNLRTRGTLGDLRQHYNEDVSDVGLRRKLTKREAKEKFIKKVTGKKLKKKKPTSDRSAIEKAIFG